MKNNKFLTSLITSSNQKQKDQKPTLKQKLHISLTKLEEDLLKVAINEYNDLFPIILQLSQIDFLKKLSVFMNISLQYPDNLSKNTLNKIIGIIKYKYYDPEYFKINKLIQSIVDIDKVEKYSSTNYIPHCNKTSINNPVHSCGEKFYIVGEGYFLCLKCRYIYHSNCILFHCDSCDVDYYTSISTNKEKDKDNSIFKLATWENYHCNAVINDIMKCQKCNNYLYINTINNKLYCIKCKIEFEQNELKWKCLICKNEFTSKAKVYNKLEYKNIKMTVKQALFDMIKAKPLCIPCCGVYGDEVNEYSFYHKKECYGLLYEGMLNNTKVVVCSKCHLMNKYENQNWMCPICKERFKVNNGYDYEYNNNNNNNFNNNNFNCSNYNSNNVKSSSKINGKNFGSSKLLKNGKQIYHSNSSSKLGFIGNFKDNENLIQTNFNHFLRFSSSNTNLNTNLFTMKRLESSNVNGNYNKDYFNNNYNYNYDCNKGKRLRSESLGSEFARKDGEGLLNGKNNINFNTNINININNSNRDYNSKNVYKKDDGKDETFTNFMINKDGHIDNNIESTKKRIIRHIRNSSACMKLTKNNNKMYNNFIMNEEYESEENNNNNNNNINYINNFNYNISNINGNNENNINVINTKSKENNLIYNICNNDLKISIEKTSINEKIKKLNLKNSNKADKTKNNNYIYSHRINNNLNSSFNNMNSNISSNSKNTKSTNPNNSSINNNNNILNANIIPQKNLKNTSNSIQKQSTKLNNNSLNSNSSSNNINNNSELNINYNYNPSSNIKITKNTNLINSNSNNYNISSNYNSNNDTTDKSDLIKNQIIDPPKQNKNKPQTKIQSKPTSQYQITRQLISKNNQKLIQNPTNPTNQNLNTTTSINNNNLPTTTNIIKPLNFNSDDYTIISQIGEGTFGKIYEVKDPNSNVKYAMKKIISSNIRELSQLKKEYEMLISLSDYQLNIVTIHAIETRQLDKTTFAMYILMDKGVRDWEKEIERRRIKKLFYNECELIKILKELVHTLSEMQKHKVSHRDIKPQNILLFDDGSYRITDFGEAKNIIRDTFNQTVRGTELYMSPILFKALREKGQNFKKYTEHNTYKSDVFSLGLCFLLAATLTFKSLCDIREVGDMMVIKGIVSRYLKRRYSCGFIDVLFDMIELNEKNRLDFVELEQRIMGI